MRTGRLRAGFGPAAARAPGGGGSAVLELAPAAGPVIRDDLPEHRGEGGRVDGLALADGHRAGGLVAVPAGDDAVRVRDDAAVVEEYVHVVLRRQQGADVAVQHEVRLP